MRQFLSLFPGGHTFQTFCDLPDADEGLRRRLTHVLHGDFATLETRLRTLNELGAGVYFSIHETDGEGRAGQNVRFLRAVVCEFDHGIPPAKLEPTLAVESSPGKQQWYWLLAEPLPATPENVARWNALETAVVTSLGGDGAAKLVTQVLRVPGFMNRKYTPAPTVVWLDEGDITKYYTLDELEAAWPPLLEAGQTKLPPPAENLMDDNGLPPEDVRKRRFAAWLKGHTEIPEAGKGERNGWYYAKVAAALRDFAIDDVDWLIEIVADHSATHHGQAAYDEDDVRRLVRNARRSSTGQRGQRVAPIFVPTVGGK